MYQTNMLSYHWRTWCCFVTHYAFVKELHLLRVGYCPFDNRIFGAYRWCSPNGLYSICTHQYVDVEAPYVLNNACMVLCIYFELSFYIWWRIDMYVYIAWTCEFNERWSKHGVECAGVLIALKLHRDAKQCTHTLISPIEWLLARLTFLFQDLKCVTRWFHTNNLYWWVYDCRNMKPVEIDCCRLWVFRKTSNFFSICHC